MVGLSARQWELAVALIPYLDFKVIRLQRSSAIVHRRETKFAEGLTLNLQAGCRDTSIKSNVLLVSLEFNLSVGDVSGESPIFELDAIFEAVYGLQDLNLEAPEESLASFGAGNALLNCWPYFREFAQSMSTRIGLPAVAVPFMVLNTVKQDEHLELESGQY